MASTSNDFAWKITRPGRWERDIDEAEQSYTSLAKAYEGCGRIFFAMTGFISFSVSIEHQATRRETEKKVEEALKKAWIRLRYDHPTIGSRVEYDVQEKKCKKIYETFSETFSQQMWLDNTFRIISDGSSGIEWCNSDPPVPTLPTLFLIKASSSNDERICADLVLRAHHDIIDGMGTLILFNNLFSHAAQTYEKQSGYTLPQFGDEWVNLSPPLRTAAAIPPSLRLEQKERIRETVAFNASKKNHVEIASPLFKRDRSQPGKHQRVAVTLSEDQTKRLLDTCRRVGLSVTHAYHAAIAIVVRDVQERRENERKIRYINYSLINQRPLCNYPYSTSAHPASVYHSGSGRSLIVDLTVPALSNTTVVSVNEQKRAFMDVAQIVRDFYLKIRDDKEHIFLVPSYFAMSTIPYPADGTTPLVPARNETPSVSISSMGILDKVICHTHGDFDLADPWVTGEELGTGLGLFLGTWKDRLTLSAAYNDAWHDSSEVLDVLERCNQATFQGLGV